MLKASPKSGWKLWRWTGACHGSAASCSLRMKARRFVTASFVPPGDRLNPYPLGTASTVNDGLGTWSIQVVSASEQESNLVVDLRATLDANNSWTFGLAYLAYVKERTGDEVAIGNAPRCPSADNSFIFVGANVPPWGPGYVTNGQTVTGDLCFPLNARASALFFAPTTDFPPPSYPGPSDPPYPPPYRSVWFALH